MSGGRDNFICTVIAVIVSPQAGLEREGTGSGRRPRCRDSSAPAFLDDAASYFGKPLAVESNSKLISCLDESSPPHAEKRNGSAVQNAEVASVRRTRSSFSPVTVRYASKRPELAGSGSGGRRVLSRVPQRAGDAKLRPPLSLRGPRSSSTRSSSAGSRSKVALALPVHA